MSQTRIIRPGPHAWRVTDAGTAGVLVDAADYYHAFHRAAAQARRSILISGWEFDSGVPLLRGADAPPGAEVRLLPFLDGLCRKTPSLYVCLLAWDFHVVLAAEREWMQRLYFHWLTHEHLHFRVDDSPVSGGSHHQKFVVIDGRLAFLGGMDLRHVCWDDRRHLVENPDRLSHGKPHQPYHDVQCYLAGGAAPVALEQYFFMRWRRAGGTPPPLPPPMPGDAAYRPRGALVLGPGPVALSRTQPRRLAPSVREVERLHEDALEAAERLVYIETQYFSSERVREALVRRMRATDRPRLQIVIVLNERAEALKEEIAVGLRQADNLETLRAVAAETGHALGCYASLPAGAGEDTRPTYIHTKLMVVDDRFLTIGSANLTNRSMGLDSELHASWEARETDTTLSRRIRRVRVSLLAEHAGVGAHPRARAPSRCPHRAAGRAPAPPRPPLHRAAGGAGGGRPAIAPLRLRQPRARLAYLTICGHNVVMKTVGIAELKARLSEYLRAVRRGETISVLDRDTPIAQIVPVRERAALRVRKPARGAPPLNRVPLPEPLETNVDIVQLLLEERQSHR